jgi:hypothetical protein
MDTQLIRELVADLDKNRGFLETAKADLGRMQLSGHQTSIYVMVGNHKYDLSYLDRSTGYMSELIRGREMLMLGAKKAMRAEVERLAQEVTTIERDLAGATP